MAITIGPNEISLNGVKYPLVGKVRPSLASTFPEKTVIGDYSIDSDPVASTWAMSDWTGGILLEEMDVAKAAHRNKAYWSTCDLRFPGSMTLPGLATAVTIPDTTSGVTNDPQHKDLDFEAASTDTTWAGNISQSAVSPRSGTNAGRVTTNDGDTYTGTQDVPWYSEYQSKAFTFTMYAKRSNAGVTYKIGINDGVTTTYCSAAASATYAKITHTKTLAAAATQLQLICWVNDATGGGPCTTDFDDGTLYTVIDGDPIFCEFDSMLYMGKGNNLSVLNEDGDEFETVKNDFEAKIRTLDSSLNSCMYIGLGDARNYWYLQIIENCADNWDELIDTDATSTTGSGRVILGVAAGMAAGDIIATEVISADLTNCSDVYFNIESSITVSEGDLELLIDETALCASPDKTLEVSALTAGVKTPVTLALGDTLTLNAVISIGLEQDVDGGACTIYVYPIYAFAQADETAVTLSAQWDDKEFFSDSDGQMKYDATPNAASPSMTANGKLDLPDNYLKNLVLYRDADGDYVIYGATRQGLWIHDYTNAKWIETELTSPDHATGGMGADVWRDALYISSGLHVDYYKTGTTANIDSVGLDEYDGLPATRGGEIVKHIKGSDALYALVDSQYEGATSRSTVMRYDKLGWQCFWEAGSNNLDMHNGIESSIYAYRLWFDASDTVYYIPLYAYLAKPKKISTYTYAASGTHITPWFDAGWPNGDKLALKFKTKTSGCSANETVTVSYRTDHTNTDLTTGWTSMGAITTNTTTTYTFGSDAGTSFKSIQFKFALARGGTTTNSPCIEWTSFVYLKKANSASTISWQYQFTVDCNQTYNHKSKSQLVDAVKTAVESTTLVQLGFRNDTGGTDSPYGEIRSVNGDVQTGIRKQGQYTLVFVAP